MAIFGDINYTDPVEGTLYSYNGTTYDVYLNYTFAVLLSGDNCLQKRLCYFKTHTVDFRAFKMACRCLFQIKTSYTSLSLVYYPFGKCQWHEVSGLKYGVNGVN